MKSFLFKFTLKYIHLIPHSVFNFFLFKNNQLIKSKILFDTTEYQSEYEGDNLSIFFLPLLINIYKITSDIKKITSEKKIVSVISVLVFHEQGSEDKYTHSLVNSNKLYSLDDFDKWPDNVLFNLVEKLELYNSFKKISFNVKIKIITHI